MVPRLKRASKSPAIEGCFSHDRQLARVKAPVGVRRTPCTIAVCDDASFRVS